MDQSEPPIRCATLVELARHRAARQPRRRAYTFLRSGETADAHLTYAELDAEARRIAALLQQQFEAGDRVVLAYSLGREFVPAFFGCLYAGVVAVLAPPPSGTAEVARLNRIAAESGAIGLCTGSTGFNLGHLGLASPSLHRRLRCLTTTAPAAAPGDWREPALDPDGPAFIQYTSGATGAARGVVVSHRNVLHNQRLIQAALGTSARTRAVGWLPPHHDMGLIGHVIQPLYVGATSVLMSPAAFLARPVRWLQAIMDHKASLSGGPNFAYELCIRRVTSEQMFALDLSRWDVAYNGAEMVRPETLERFAARFASCGFRRQAFVSCYGLAEATLLVSASAKSAPPAVRRVDAEALCQRRVQPASDATRNVRSIVACGTPPAQQVLIVDPETHAPVAEDRVGEIWVRGDSIAAGYWNDRAATQRTFRARLAGGDDDGGTFLRTGDLGFLQAGALHVVGRLNELVRLDGRHYDPGDIEEAVRASHPALRDGDAAAFSIDAAGHEGNSGLIVLHELQRHAWRRVPHSHLESAARSALRDALGVDLRQMVLLVEGTLPKTTSGKVSRPASRDAYLRNALAAAAAGLQQ